jgi:hypothetical protein
VRAAGVLAKGRMFDMPGLDDPGFDLWWEQETIFLSLPVQNFSRCNLLCSGYRAIAGGKAVEACRYAPSPAYRSGSQLLVLCLCFPFVTSRHVTEWPCVNGYYSLDYGLRILMTYSLVGRY